MKWVNGSSTLLLLAPLVLLADLLLLAGSEVVLNVESLPDFLRGFPFDHVGHCLAGDVQETLQDGCELNAGLNDLLTNRPWYRDSLLPKWVRRECPGQPSGSQRPRSRYRQSSSLCSRHPREGEGHPCGRWPTGSLFSGWQHLHWAEGQPPHPE